MPKGWIYRMSKPELMTELDRFGLSTEGTIDELRRRMSTFVDANPHTPQGAMESESVEPTPPAVARSAHESPETIVKGVNQIRKWGCHFDGRDPVAFLERVEELREAYQIPGANLLLGLPELMRGDALLWLRNNRGEWRCWEDFCQDFRDYYLPGMQLTS